MSLFKVLRIDNYNREYIPEYIEEENLTFVEANALCFALRTNPKRPDDKWYVVKRQTAHMWQGIKEFM